MTTLPRTYFFRPSAIAVFSVVAAHTAHAQTAMPADATPAPLPQQQFQASGDWEKLPKMPIERQFAGPLRDTVIQRLRDPVDGTICYLYLPVSAPHSLPQSTGFVQYGSNTIGSINCMPPPLPQTAPPSVPRKP